MLRKKMLPLKFTNYGIGFREVPNEVSILINIANCPYSCEGCHSPELQKDEGALLTKTSLDDIIMKYKECPITCICFMGDGGNISAIGELVEYCYRKGFITCLYTGSTNIEEAIISSNRTLDYIKTGTYNKNLGPLNIPTTNQKFYRIKYHYGTEIKKWYELENITYMFQ